MTGSPQAAPFVITCRGRVLCAQCTVARTSRQRLRGLIGRPLPAGGGLLIVPCASVHTAFMRRAIDVVFLDRAGCVLRVVPALGPWRVVACRGSRAVLELPAGTCTAVGVAAGVTLRSAGAELPGRRNGWAGRSGRPR
ncbi:hypothetical protein DSM112329_05226 [Paraconexibacter sp. AEG42_29]|uniref:DUF192 domain-containing protein n=1 Tax=Paraconexibacter sp. AEG42_29 TaxID=2997339 RepID=A0AAU7B383_9ACTN